MSKVLFRAIVVILLNVSVSVVAEKLPKPELYPGINRQTVIEYCDTRPIDNLEGLWSFPDDNVLLFIKKNSRPADYADRCHYSIIVVEAEDQYLTPGQEIGYLSITPDAEIYRMWLFTELISGLPAVPQECVATLVEDAQDLTFRKKEHRVKFNPLGILPNFWKIIKVQTSDPVKNLPKGFVKIHPSYDGNGSMPNVPRYL